MVLPKSDVELVSPGVQTPLPLLSICLEVSDGTDVEASALAI